MSAVIDTSVFVDALFVYNRERSRRAHNVFRLVSDAGLTIVEPPVFSVELAAQLVRRKPRSEAEKIYEEIVGKIVLLDVAFSTGCRAVDAHFIAAATIAGAPLVTADQRMAKSAKKYGVRAYYILDEAGYRELLAELGSAAPQ